jgi:ribosomal-protein-serine acetyltransferase
MVGVTANGAKTRRRPRRHIQQGGDPWRPVNSDDVFTFEIADDCHLRMLEEGDAQELSDLIDANRDHLARWMPWAASQTVEGTLEFIRATRRQFAGNDGFQAVIVRGGRIVGVCGFHAVNWPHRSTSIGYWLDEREQGQGIMTRSVRALVDHALSAWRLNRVEIRAAPENRRSRAIPERLGFREEGVLKEAERVGERHLDSVVYGIVASARA